MIRPPADKRDRAAAATAGGLDSKAPERAFRFISLHIARLRRDRARSAVRQRRALEAGIAAQRGEA